MNVRKSNKKIIVFRAILESEKRNMIYFSKKLNKNVDIDLIYEAIQQGYRVSDNFHGFFLKKSEDCICYNSFGSSAYSNTKENLKKIVEMLDKHFDLNTFKIGKDLYVNMI